jgi:tRNA pseudouridine55 synthase
MHCFLNIYKPKGISSAKLVAIIKRFFPGQKIGHAGTLDVEAEGVLPIAIGEATKLMQFLVEAKKTYVFTIKFGARTDSADASGKIMETTDHIPAQKECNDICTKFIGQINQRPNMFSAIKVAGVRSYKLARSGGTHLLPYRAVTIYKLDLLAYDIENNTAQYRAVCSKGTYIRTLGEDIALSLQSLGFVLELARTKVGAFTEENSIDITKLEQLSAEEKLKIFVHNSIRVEAILDDISVIDATDEQAIKIKFGQKCLFTNNQDIDLVWIRYRGFLLAIGSVKDNCFNSLRVFNLI